MKSSTVLGSNSWAGNIDLAHSAIVSDVISMAISLFFTSPFIEVVYIRVNFLTTHDLQMAHPTVPRSKLLRKHLNELHGLFAIAN
jgi:hypothetical protein